MRWQERKKREKECRGGKEGKIVAATSPTLRRGISGCSKGAGGLVRRGWGKRIAPKRREDGSTLTTKEDGPRTGKDILKKVIFYRWRGLIHLCQEGKKTTGG